MSINFPTQLPHNSNEELLIRAQVDEIYQIEEKINLLNDQLNKNDTQNIFLKKIDELKSFRNNLLQKKIKLNEVFYTEMQKIADEIQDKFSDLKNLENNITSLKNELYNYNIISFQNLQLKKIILAKNIQKIGKDEQNFNFFLTEEEINDIILENIDISKNPEIIKLKRDIEINKASEKVIMNNYNEINSKIAQIQENLKMLKEEKNTTKYELINLISCKESLESIIKLNINQLNIHNNKQAKNNNSNEKGNTEIDNENEETENNKWTKPNELFMYELQAIDPYKAAKIICSQLFNVFDINIEEEEEENNKNNKDNFNTIDDYSFNNKSKISKGKKIINESFNEYNTINNSNNNSFFLQNSIIPPYANNKNKKMNLKSSNLSNISSIFSKNIILSYIQNELDKYISGEINSYKTIYEFLENLSIIIISKFQYANIIISADTLTIYLSYIFKSIFYDTIINAKIKFVNKDYKNTKKNYKKLIIILSSELTKLDTKFQEYKSKTEIIQKQIKLIENSEKNYDIKKIKEIKLTKDEQNYIQICTKGNGLNKQKKEVEKVIYEYESKKNEIKQEKDDMINKINEEINNIDNEIVQTNKEMKIKKNELNNDINNYKQIIKEKYDIINEQLQMYKDKYGSNLDIYNRLINSINNTIKKSDSKQALIIINNNNINNSNIIYKPKKVNKASSNIDIIKPNFDTIRKSKKIRNNYISISNLSNDFQDSKNKTFYSTNISRGNSKLSNKNNKNKKRYISNIIDRKINNYTNDKRYEKYNKCYNNYYHKDITQKSLNINLDSSNNSINRKYKSYSFITSKNSQSNFNNNITRKKLGLIPHSKDMAIYQKINMTNRSSHSHYNSTFLNKTDLNKLNNTLQGLKNIISHRSEIREKNNKIIDKIKPLTKTIFCFYRNYYNLKNSNLNNSKMHKYNPLLNTTAEALSKFPYNFIPGKLFLDLNQNLNINISPIKNDENNKIIFNISDIENTIVSSKLKFIIEVLRNFRKYKESNKFKSIEDFVENEIGKKSNQGLNKEEIEKCIVNKNFNFLIAIKGGVMIELIICSYEEFKMWINGLAFLIKNKNDIIQYLVEI